MKKKLLLIVALLIIAISVIMPAAVLADEPALNYVDAAATSSIDDGQVPASPVILTYNFSGLDTIYTFEVKARYGTYIGVSVVDCCIPGDWWRANIVYLSGGHPVLAATTHSELTAGYITPLPGDPLWSPEAIMPNVDGANLMKAVVTIACANDIPGGFVAGMWVKITSDAKSIDIVPVPSI